MTRISLLAKAPIPGQVKTRLLPALSAQQACDLHRTMVEHAVTQACRAQLGEVQLYCSAAHPFFEHLAKHFDIELKYQVAGDLGIKITQALSSTPTETLVIGCDCPVIDWRLLQQCANALGDSQLVFLPAEDGGFGLVGMHRPNEFLLQTLFHQLPWGTAQVMALLRDAMTFNQCQWRELETIWDVDRPMDLERLAKMKIPGIESTENKRP